MASDNNNQAGDVTALIHEGMRHEPDLTEQLFRVFDPENPKWSATDSPCTKAAEALHKRLCDVSTNDISLLFASARTYPEVLAATAEHLKIEVDASAGIVQVEKEILAKLVNDSIEQMDEETREAFFEDLQASVGSSTAFAFGPGVIFTAQLLGRYGGFLTYRLAVTFANQLARMVIGKGMTFAANAALTRGLSVFLGPVASSLSALWFAYELLGPSYRKMIASVVHIAAIRAALERHSAIGIVGQDLAGADSVASVVFGVDPLRDGRISARNVGVRTLVLNASGSDWTSIRMLDDWEDSAVTKPTSFMTLNIIVVVLDATRAEHKTAARLVELVRATDRPFVVLLNKIDLIPDTERDRLVDRVVSSLRLDDGQLVPCALVPNERYATSPLGVDEARAAIEACGNGSRDLAPIERDAT